MSGSAHDGRRSRKADATRRAGDSLGWAWICLPLFLPTSVLAAEVGYLVEDVLPGAASGVVPGLLTVALIGAPMLVIGYFSNEAKRLGVPAWRRPLVAGAGAWLVLALFAPLWWE